MARGDCNTMSEGSGIYSGGEGPFCRNDSYATLRLQAVLVKALLSQGRMKQQESLYEYRLMSPGQCIYLRQEQGTAQSDGGADVISEPQASTLISKQRYGTFYRKGGGFGIG
ncbi:UNVERIFIED_CONTAM: hypothetical protein FKN15_062680 [Acipenser sinensis]